MEFILGHITGKVTTRRFNFLVEGDAQKFDYTQVYHEKYGHVLCQIIELEKTTDRVLAKCIIIGYNDKFNNIKQIRSPFDVDTEVKKANDDFVKSIVMDEETKKGAYMGILEGTRIPVYLDLNKLLTKHVAVLAKSGSGKSYSVGVLLEEIMDKNVPLLIIDTHGEYTTLKQENDNIKEIGLMKKFKIKAKSYSRKVSIYGDNSIDESFKPLKLNENLNTEEIIDLLPTKLSNSQMGLFYSTIKDIEVLNLDNLILGLQASDNNLKWNLINVIEYLKNINLFSANPTSLNELIQSGRCSIINMKGYDPNVQEIIVYKLLKDLFAQRKLDKIPPFFLVIEEAHNYIPEKGFSDAKPSKIIKTIASEGRKFGLGLCVVSQRPAIVQKTVLSQCTTQIILKITNPNDLKAVSNSVEGLTSETESEVKNLPIGTALVTGVVDMPLFVNVRPRRTKHGGEAVDILGMQEGEDKFFDNLKDFKDKKLLPLIKPKINPKDIKLMSSKDVDVNIVLIPCILFLCEKNNKDFSILIEMLQGSVVKDIENVKIKTSFLPELDKMSTEELKVLEKAFKLKRFTKESFIKSTGLSLESEKIINDLNLKGYLDNKFGNYEISEKYILTDLAKYAFYTKIEYARIDFKKVLQKKQRIDSVKARLSKLTNVKDQRECFLVHYTT